MQIRRFCLILVAALFLPAAVAQEGRVIVANASNKELKRTAHRLRMTVDRLKNARDVLQQATDLAGRLDPIPGQRMGNLAQMWLQLYKSKASSSIELMMEEVRRAAAKAPNLAAYQQSCIAFQTLLSPLAQVDSERAAQQARQWPRPPQSLGDAGETMLSQQMDQYQRQLLQQLMYQDPEKAAKLYAQLGPGSGTDYYIPAQLALGLARAGEKDQAYKLVDQVLADFGKGPSNPTAYQNFYSFLQQVSNLDPNKFMEGFNLLLASQAKGQVPLPQSNATLTVGDKTLELDGNELQLLNMLRGMSGRPGLIQQALGAVPDFKAKLDSIGGIDTALNPSASAGGGISISQYIPGAGVIGSGRTVIYGSGPRAPQDRLSTLFNELKGKATKDPGLVRQRISTAVKGPEDVDFLINLAQRSSYEDPELGSIALEIATGMLPQVEPLQRRSMVMQNLVRVYRSCDGEVDVNLLRDGFILADQLRQDEKEKNPLAASQRPGNSPADYLEQTLLGEVASDHFDAAMKYLHAMPDDEAKLAALQRIVESLRQYY